MKIIADTNLLVRLVVDDDPEQTRLTQTTMAQAERVVVSLHALCEMVWVLRSKYRFKKADIVAMVERIRKSKNVELDRAAVDAGLATMIAGADFADGVIDYEGRCLGGETFVSFDKKAVEALAKQGQKVRLLA
jgi:predicted nucleic-acid-binding protein